MNKGSQIKIGSALSYAQMAINILLSLIYTPIMVRLLGKGEYGLYQTVASTVSMLSVLNLGFSSGYIRYHSKYKSNNDYVSIYKLNGLFLIIFTIIGIVALCCGLYLCSHLQLVFKDGLTSTEYDIAYVLMLILTLNLAISFPMSVFSNIITANERFVFLKLVGMIRTILNPIITIPLLLLGYGSIAIVSVTLFLSIIVDSAYAFFVLKKLKYRFVFRGFDNNLFKDLFRYTFFIAINLIIDQINWGVDKILLGRYKGTATVAVYSIGSTLQGYYQTLSSSISGLFTPRIHKIVNSISDSDTIKRELTSIFTKVGRIQFFILALFGSGFVLWGREFIGLWVGDGYEESYFVAMLLMLPETIPLIQNLGIEIQRAENKHQFRSLLYAAMAIINLVLTVYLCQIYGAVGAAFGTAVSLIIANGLLMNIFYYRHCDIDVIYFWKNILFSLKGMIIPILIGVVLKKFVQIDSYLGLLIVAFIYAVSYFVSIYFLSFNQEEKKLCLSIIQKLKMTSKR